MVGEDDKITHVQQCEAVIRDALQFAARCGANESDLEKMVHDAGVPRSYLRNVVADTGITMDGLLSWTFKRLMAVLDHAAGYGEDALRALEHIFESHVRFVIRNPVIAKLLRHILGNPHDRVREHVRKIMRAYEHEIAVIVQQAKRNDLVRADVDAKETAIAFVSLVQAQMLRMQILDDAHRVRCEAHATLEIFLNGIRAVPLHHD